MNHLPKELINDIIQFNKYPNEVYKITYFAVCCQGGGIQKLTSFLEVVENSGHDMDIKKSTISKKFLNKILEKELPHNFESATNVYPPPDIDCVGYYDNNFEPIICKIQRIN